MQLTFCAVSRSLLDGARGLNNGNYQICGKEVLGVGKYVQGKDEFMLDTGRYATTHVQWGGCRGDTVRLTLSSVSPPP